MHYANANSSCANLRNLIVSMENLLREEIFSSIIWQLTRLSICINKFGGNSFCQFWSKTDKSVKLSSLNFNHLLQMINFITCKESSRHPTHTQTKKKKQKNNKRRKTYKMPKTNTQRNKMKNSMKLIVKIFTHYSQFYSTFFPENSSHQPSHLDSSE